MLNLMWVFGFGLRFLLVLISCPFVCTIVATTVGTVVAYLLVPMRSLGSNSWKIAAALMGRHIGGGDVLTTL